MKKTPKKFFKPKKNDLPSVYIAILALAVIVVVFFLAYFSKVNRMSNLNAGESNQPAMSGQQVATLTILPSGSNATATSSASLTVVPAQTQQIQSNLTIAENMGSVPANGRVQFKIDHFKKLALQPLVFDVFDTNGKAYTPADLQDVNGQKIHFIVVSANLSEYQHLNPAYQNGKWNVLANLPNVGTYYAYTDITPVKGSHVVLRSDLIVQQPTAATVAYPGLTPNLVALNKGYSAQLSLNQPLILQQSTLSFAVTNGGKAAQLGPYLAGFGYLVVFRQGDVDSYTVINPVSPAFALNGQVQFMTSFVKGGRYTAFAEFKLGNAVLTFPVTFDING
jgi:hypothetical protein